MGEATIQRNQAAVDAKVEEESHITVDGIKVPSLDTQVLLKPYIKLVKYNAAPVTTKANTFSGRPTKDTANCC